MYPRKLQESTATAKEAGKVSFRLGNAVANLPFFYYYIGPAAFVSYLLAGKSLLGRFSYRGIFVGFSLAAYLAAIVVSNGVVDGLYVIRFFWGFLLFYLAFRLNIQIQTDKLLLFLSALTIVEAVLINTFIPAESLPNFPSIEVASGHFAGEGNYQRPYSFGGSASVTSVILVALLAISKMGWAGKFAAVAAICACMSGSGFIALSIYLLAIARPILRLVAATTILGLVYSGEIQKISLDYIHFLFAYKMEQFETQIPVDSLLIGIPIKESVNGMGGDFAFLSFIELNGLAGLLFFLLVVVMNANKSNRLPIFLLLVGSIHYGVMYYFPGQLMFGYFLNLRPTPINANAPIKAIAS